jgi:ribose transport system substrate-binding protein
MKPLSLLTLSVALILSTGLLGCDSSSSKAKNGAKSEDGSKKLVIAAIPKSTGGEFWETVEQGAREAAKDLDVELKWEGTLTETEIAEQNNIIENMINLGVDGIAIAPLNNMATAKSVASAVSAGIPVVVFDSSLNGDKHTAFVATDNVAGGGLGAKRMIEKLGSGDKKVMVLRYVQGTASTENRAKGFMAAVTQAGMEVVADPYPEDGQVAGCKKTASNTLEGFIKNGTLELDGVFACNLNAALGMNAALSDLRKSNVEMDLTFVGFDTSPKLIKSLQAGDIDSLVSQDPKKMGYIAVETIVKHLRGEKVAAKVDTGVELVTAERIENEPAIRALVGAK